MFIGIGTWVHFPGSALECKNIGLDLFMSRPLCLYAVTLITSGCVLFFISNSICHWVDTLDGRQC